MCYLIERQVVGYHFGAYTPVETPRDLANLTYSQKQLYALLSTVGGMHFIKGNWIAAFACVCGSSNQIVSYCITHCSVSYCIVVYHIISYIMSYYVTIVQCIAFNCITSLILFLNAPPLGPLYSTMLGAGKIMTLSCH